MDYITARAYRIFSLAHGGGIPTAGDIALYRGYAVLSFAKGDATTPKDVHDMWSAWIVASYPEHRSLKPFDQLTPDVQKMDSLYVEAIHRASQEAT